MKTVPCTPL